MAIASTTVWEIRATGSDTNAGGYNPARTGAGVDYSQQAAAQISVTDAVANGTTTVTSATAGFVTGSGGHTGNLAYIGGAWYEITSVTNSTTVVVDRTVTTATGLTLKVGGALATVGACNAVKVSGNLAWLKAGTYTSATRQDWSDTAAGTWDGSTANQTRLIGYNATRGDNPRGLSNCPALTGSAAGVDVFGYTGAAVYVANIVIDGANTSRDGLVELGTGTTARGGTVQVVTVKRCSRYGANFSAAAGTVHAAFVRVTAMKAASTAAFRGASAAMMNYCVADNNACNGWSHGGNNEADTLVRCIACHNTGGGFVGDNYLGSASFAHCVAYRNGAGGWNVADGSFEAVVQLLNSLAYGNTGGYGVKGKTRSLALAAVNYNAYGSNTSGSYFGWSASGNDVSLSADPYTGADAASVAACDTIDDVFALFRPNATAGGGGALRGAGFPAYSDIGAAQHQDAGGGGGTTGVSRSRLVNAGG